jgi:hypothetical protein
MPLTRIEIEQIEQTRWVAEVEVGGMTARRITVRGGSFEEIMIGVEDAYRAYAPKPLNPAIDSDQQRLLAEKVYAHEPPDRSLTKAVAAATSALDPRMQALVRSSRPLKDDEH